MTRSPDKVGLIQHVHRRAAGDSDEHRLVEPIQVRCGGFNACCRMEERLSGLVTMASANTTRSHIEQSAAVSLQCVADLGRDRAIRCGDLPCRAAAWQQAA